METERKKKLNKLLIFARSRMGEQVEIFRKVCDELDIEPIFIKGSQKNGAANTKSESDIVSAVVFQTHDTGDDLNLISEIKLTLRKVPIIFYSTRYSEGIEALIRRTGVHYFLTPSFEQEELALVLETLLENSEDGSLHRIG